MKLPVKTKLVFLVLVIILFFGTLTALAVFKVVSDNLIKTKRQELLNSNVNQAHEISLMFDNHLLFVKMLASRTRVTEYLIDPSEVRRKELAGIFDGYAKTEKQYLAIYLLNDQGTAKISTDPTFIDKDYSFRNYFKRAISGQAHIEPLVGVTSKQLGYYFSYPVKDLKGEKVIGVAVAKLDPNPTHNLLSEYSKNNQVNIMFTDEEGIVLYSSKPDRTFSSLGKLDSNKKKEIEAKNNYATSEIKTMQYDILQQAVKKQETNHLFDYRDEVDNENEILSLSRLNNYPFFLVYEVDTESITKSIYQIVGLIGIGVFMAAMIAAFSISLLLGRLLRPLDKINDFSQEIGKGNFKSKLEINSHDEFQSLAETLNKMVSELSNLYSGLEDKVKERTERLERLNKFMVGRELKMIELKKQINKTK